MRYGLANPTLTTAACGRPSRQLEPRANNESMRVAHAASAPEKEYMYMYKPSLRPYCSLGATS